MKELFQEVDKINRLIFEAQAAVNAAIERLEQVKNRVPALRRDITEYQKSDGDPGICIADTITEPVINRLRSSQDTLQRIYITTPGFSRMMIQK